MRLDKFRKLLEEERAPYTPYCIECAEWLSGR